MKERPEYVVTTSEFNDVKLRLMALHNRRKVDEKDLSRPQLKKKPGTGVSADDPKDKPDQDERPTPEAPHHGRLSLTRFKSIAKGLQETAGRFSLGIDVRSWTLLLQR